MTKRKADIEDNLLLPSKVPKKFATDEEEDDDSDDGKKYEILKEDDIEGQEEGEVTTEGNIQITPFNMKEELEEGYFDSEGMYHWNKKDDVKDNWLENIECIQVKDTDANIMKKQDSDTEDELPFDEIASYKEMLHYMKEGETVAATLRRLGSTSSLSASEKLKMKKAGKAIVKNNENKEAFDKVTELADSIMSNTGNMDIYGETYADILNKVKKGENKEENQKGIKEADLDMYADDFSEKEKSILNTSMSAETQSTSSTENTDSKINTSCTNEDIINTDTDIQDMEMNNELEVQWELKRDLTSETIEGPFSTLQMNRWMLSNYFGAEVWVRKVGSNTEFYSSTKISFDCKL